MKTEINRKQFTNILKTAKTFGANAIRINDNRIIAQSASSIMEIEIVDAIGTIDVTFDGYALKELQKAISVSKSPFATIEMNDDDTATIDNMIRLKTINESLDVTFNGDVQTFRIATDALQTAIANTLTFVSDNDMTPILKGINMNVTGSHTEIQFIATNRHYAARHTLQGANVSEYVASSQTFDGNMMKAIATYKTDALYTNVYQSQKWTRFAIGNAVFTLQHIDGTFPNVDKIYENARYDTRTSIVFERKNKLIEILNTLIKTTNDKRSFIAIVKYNHAARTTTITNKEGNFRATMDMYGAYGHGIDEYEIAFNSKYVLNALKTLTSDKAIINFSPNQYNPFYITDAVPENEIYEIIILPIRVPAHA